MSVLEAAIKWAVDLVGIKGIQIGLILFLASIGLAAGKVSSVGTTAGRVAYAGSYVNILLHDVKVVALVLLLLMLLGIASIHPDVAQTYIQQAQGLLSGQISLQEVLPV